MIKANLTTIPTLVESPFIIVTIGGHTFGSFNNGTYSATGLHSKVEFPNYMKSLSITKINGTVNTYTIVFSYQVAYGEDPNRLDKIFSRATKDRKITLSYGDWNSPSFIYKEETGIITNITSTLNLSNSSIDYTIKCTSDAIGLTASTFTFPAKTAKGSDILAGLVSNVKYGLSNVFTGMRDKNKVLKSGLIASDDKTISIPMQRNVSPLEYMNLVVNSMTSANGDTTSTYMLTIHDDVNNEYGGTYFTVDKVEYNTPNFLPADTYELNVNFPEDNFITQFSVTNDQSWAILYEYADKVDKQQYSYRLNNSGEVIATHAPSLVRRSNGQTSQASTNWWAKMTGFPIQVTLTLKGLTRPSILMNYVKLNVWFHGGQKHISSGLYIIIKQEDKIDNSGYKTTLTMLRVGDDK